MAEKSADPLKVIIVDDEPIMRRMIVRMLDSDSFEVTDMADEAAATEAAEQYTFDLAIIDVVLAGTDGSVLAERLRLTQPGLAVIFISGYSESVVADRGVGPDDHFLQKPFSRATLLETVQKKSRVEVEP